nr:hypothetical protein [Tanacetum cinerariifolium]
MTRILTKELFIPFEEPEQVFHSERKLFKTKSLDYSSSPEFNLFSDPENQRIARPKIDDKAHFELKGQFLKELHDSTFRRSDNEDVNKHSEKVLKIVDFFHVSEEVILFYKALDVPTRQILNFKGAIPSIKAADVKKAFQDMVD